MHKQKSAGKAARPCNSPRAQLTTLKLKQAVPENFPALLKAVAAISDCTPEVFTLEALCSVMLCHVECFNSDAREVIAAIPLGREHALRKN